jgi:hypothetical protein
MQRVSPGSQVADFAVDAQTRTALLAYFDRLYPVGPGNWPDWKQEPYRAELFTILRDALQRDRHVHGVEVWVLLERDWLPRRDDVDVHDRAVLRELCSAWSEWLYAFEQSGALGNDRDSRSDRSTDA